MKLLIAGLLLLSGCQQGFYPSFSSSYSRQQVAKDANRWESGFYDRTYTTVSQTGSMVPFLDEYCYILLEGYNGQAVHIGDVLVFDRGDEHDVIHIVVNQTETMVYMSGFNNHNSDGWYPKSKIKQRLAGILFTNREKGD